MTEATGSKSYCLHFPVRTRLIVFAVLKIMVTVYLISMTITQIIGDMKPFGKTGIVAERLNDLIGIGDLLTTAILGYVLLPLVGLAIYVNSSPYMLIFVIIFIVIVLGAFILFITDFVVTVILLYKMHKKNMNTIKRYYTFNFAILVVMIMIALAAIGFGLYALFGGYLPLLAVQSYFLSLLSEVIKQECSDDLTAEKNAADTQPSISKEKEADLGTP